MNKVIESSHINNKKYEIIFFDEKHHKKALELNHLIVRDPQTRLFLSPIRKSVLSRCLSNGSGFGIGIIAEKEMAAYRLVLYPNQNTDLYLDHEDPALDMSVDIPKVQLKYLARLAGVAVHPLFRRHRLASTLTKIALRLLKQNDFRYALTSCHPKNEYSLRHLTKLGFKACALKKRENGNHRLILFNDFFEGEQNA
ncbi:MAG: GNAT family N-acetyltransferase [Chloroflexi bacterium]|nr:GNAT family N-acetyltransferase [Chloroflexota bacterium]